ncbi:MAG: PAS domain-containing protein [Ferrovibrio sp.]|uniref:PAS domain-containing protein n=1 Tax=Ferrovibrio sp. TaxID=1917215 RepID=UPI00391B3867
MMTQQPIFADEPALAVVAAYWQALRQGRLMPDRADIDPLDLPPSLWPNLLITEPAESDGDNDGVNWRYRLVGSAHVERYTYDFTGRTTGEIMHGSYLDYMNRIYATAFHQRVPVYSESVFRWDVEGYAATRRLMLPISHGKPGVSARIFSVQVWPSEKPLQPRSISEISRRGEFRDGFFLALDRDTFQPLPQQDRAPLPRLGI